jgi:hypothetical protein
MDEYYPRYEFDFAKATPAYAAPEPVVKDKHLVTTICYVCAKPFYENEMLTDIALNEKRDIVIHANCKRCWIDP